MTMAELEFKLDILNTDISDLDIYYGEEVSDINAISCWEEGGVWFLQKVNDEGEKSIQSGPEEEILDKLYSHIKFRHRIKVAESPK